jgi:hypothetical protein
MKLSDVLKDNNIIAETIEDIEELITLTEDGHEYLIGYTGDARGLAVYNPPTVIWNGGRDMPQHQSNGNSAWSKYVHQLIRAVPWKTVRDQYVDKKLGCAYCGAKLQDITGRAFHAEGLFCSTKCADKADLALLLGELEKEKKISV